MGVSALARRYQIDVSSDGTTWTQLLGVTDFNPQITPQLQDSSTYDSDGWGSSEITMNKWSAAIKVLRQTSGGVFDPGQELVRARVAQFGDNARIYVRWYDNSGAPEAYSGRAIVEFNRSKTGVSDLDEASITLTGDGALTPISNPYAPSVVPTILSATPSGVAAGGQVEITGTGFTGTVATTGVKFGGVNATSWIVLSDSVIVAVMPAGSAGSAAVVVTNATGASASFPYTRG
jgi:hypothetical protein